MDGWDRQSFWNGVDDADDTVLSTTTTPKERIERSRDWIELPGELISCGISSFRPDRQWTQWQKVTRYLGSLHFTSVPVPVRNTFLCSLIQLCRGVCGWKVSNRKLEKGLLHLDDRRTTHLEMVRSQMLRSRLSVSQSLSYFINNSPKLRTFTSEYRFKFHPSTIDTIQNTCPVFLPHMMISLSTTAHQPGYINWIRNWLTVRQVIVSLCSMPMHHVAVDGGQVTIGCGGGREMTIDAT